MNSITVAVSEKEYRLLEGFLEGVQLSRLSNHQDLIENLAMNIIVSPILLSIIIKLSQEIAQEILFYEDIRQRNGELLSLAFPGKESNQIQENYSETVVKIDEINSGLIHYTMRSTVHNIKYNLGVEQTIEELKLLMNYITLYRPQCVQEIALINQYICTQKN